MKQRLPILGNRYSGCYERGSEEYESIYAYQLVKLRPALLKVLMLPYDYIVVFDGDTIVEILNENDESVMTGLV